MREKSFLTDTEFLCAVTIKESWILNILCWEDVNNDVVWLCNMKDCVTIINAALILTLIF